MKSCALFPLVVILFFGTSEASGQTSEVFEFTDGYFTSSYGPVHLVHDRVDFGIPSITIPRTSPTENTFHVHILTQVVIII